MCARDSYNLQPKIDLVFIKSVIMLLELLHLERVETSMALPFRLQM